MSEAAVKYPFTEVAHRNGHFETRVDGVLVNETGIQPTEFKVLIRAKEVQEKIGSILLPEQAKETEKWATTEGTLIAASPLAFTYAKEEEWEAAGAQPPKPGDRILYAKYAGTHVKGRDGKEYVLANDKDVMAVLTD